MYIPLIPQRRDKLSSIWGPPTVASQKQDAGANGALRRWEHDTQHPAHADLGTRPPFEQRRDYAPRNASLDRIYQPDELHRTRSGAVLTSIYDQRREDYSTDVHAVTSLLRSLDLSAPTSYLDACLDPSLFSPSSTTSSPIDGIPTPPDSSPIHSGDARLPTSISLLSSPSSQNHLPLEATTAHEAIKSTRDDIVHDMAGDTYLHHRLSSRLISRHGSFALEPQGTNTPPRSPLESQNEDSFRTLYATNGLQEYSAASLRSNKHRHTDSDGFDALWSPVSQTQHSSSRRSGYTSRSPTSEDLNEGDFLSVAKQGDALDMLDSGKQWPGAGAQSHEPINFLHLLSPTSSPQYSVFVQRIITHSDQQASIFLQQKLKASADIPYERMKIVDAICGHGFEMMCNRFGNWAVQRCLDSNLTNEEKAKLASCMRGRVVDLATNCYGTHCVQKFLDCEERIRLDIVRELLVGDPCGTLLNKHASHVWSKIMELSWTPPAPPIFDYINEALSGKWMSLACHETGSLVVQHAFENLEPHAKEGIVQELLMNDAVFREVVKNQWGSFCVSHLIELGSSRHRQLVLDLLLSNLSEYATHEHGIKSVLKAVKEGNTDTRDRFVDRLCQPPHGGRRAMIIDIALSALGCQLLTNFLPGLNREQRSRLYDAIRPFIVTLRGSKTGSKTIWLFDRMRCSQ